MLLRPFITPLVLALWGGSHLLSVALITWNNFKLRSKAAILYCAQAEGREEGDITASFVFSW